MPIRILNSFKIRSGNKVFDYRLGKDLDLRQIGNFFQKDYQVKKLWRGPRHVLGIVEKDKRAYFLKLSTSEGMSVISQKEFDWNDYFNQYFPKNFPYNVPKNYHSGLYKQKYFYLVTEYFEGKLLSPLNGTQEESDSLTSHIPRIIELSELIQKLPARGGNYRRQFISKAGKWFNDIPEEIREKFEVRGLLDIVEKETDILLGKPRHGDFAPWHIIKLNSSNLGLLDGEHALYCSVENYDICYFIQRIFSVLKNPAVAKKIYLQLQERGYKTDKLKTVLAARAIGGFLDESLSNQPNYKIAKEFKDWVMQN